MASQNSGGSYLPDQFACGLPITGAPSHRYVSPPGDKVRDRIPPSQLFRTSARRVRERAAKSGFKDAHLMRGEALAQAKKGWILPPVALAPGGKPLHWRSIVYNIPFRFGFLQSDRIRSCDGLKHSMANLAFPVHTRPSGVVGPSGPPLTADGEERR